MNKVIVTSFIAIIFLIACNKQTQQKDKTTSMEETKDVKNSTPQKSINDFVGTYLSGQKEGGNDWVEVKIEDLKNQDSCKITVDSKERNGRKGCTFDKTGILKNDTIFIQTTDWKKPVTVIITRKDTKISIDAIEKEDGDRYVLNYYCNGGGSLIGDYTKQ